MIGSALRTKKLFTRTLDDSWRTLWVWTKIVFWTVVLGLLLYSCAVAENKQTAQEWATYDKAKADFSSFCERLEGETNFRSEAWVCIKGNDIAYQRKPVEKP